jgi:hypothetical protein
LFGFHGFKHLQVPENYSTPDTDLKTG